MRHLCDSNVFIALVMTGHLHHDTALNWFGALPAGDRVAFCRMTQNSFLRLITADNIMRPYTLTNAKALAVYRTMLENERIEFVSEPAGIEQTWLSTAAVAKMSPKLWMDAYLAAFARLANLQFVTFDKAFRQFQELDLVLLG